MRQAQAVEPEEALMDLMCICVKEFHVDQEEAPELPYLRAKEMIEHLRRVREAEEREIKSGDKSNFGGPKTFR